MEAYSGFAKVYDLFMDDVPYEKWCDGICKILSHYGITDGIVAELGCGTGAMTRLLSQRGFDMIGIDVSEEMLLQARGYGDEGQSFETKPILYLQQDMRSFELYGTVAAIVSVCDSMNYITQESELADVFSLVNNYLDPGGIFIFDMNTIHKYRDVIGDQLICDQRDGADFIWDNYYDETKRLNEYQMTFFVRGADGRYQRFEEVHIQRGYEIADVCRLLEQSGLAVEGVYAEDFTRKGDEDCERVFFVARECRKSADAT